MSKKKPTYYKQRILLITYDIIIALLSCLLILYYYLYREGQLLSLSELIFKIVFFLIVIFLFRSVFKVYRQTWRYGGMECYARLMLADAVACIVFIVSERLIDLNKITIGNTISLFSLNLLGTMASRFIYRYLYIYANENTPEGKVLNKILYFFSGGKIYKTGETNKKNIAVFGVNNSSISFVDEQLRNPLSDYNPCVFLTNDESFIGKRIRGIEIRDYKIDTSYFTRNNIKEVFFIGDDINYELYSNIKNHFKDYGLTVRTYDLKVTGTNTNKDRSFNKIVLMYITNDPKIAEIAQENGVDRIWIDLETLGKEERQKNLNTVKSKHKVSDIPPVKKILTSSQMLVRVNPWNENSIKEINDVIEAGAELVMLPMWKTPQEVSKFIKAVDGRAKTVLLLETKEAKECLDEVLKLDGIDEIHIGLNDLHLSYNMNFMFEPLANGMVEEICNKIRKKGIPYGFGGIAKIGDGTLPAEKIILEHYRLGSTRAILSRSFCDNALINDLSEIKNIFEVNMKELIEYEKYASQVSEEDLRKNQIEVEEAVEKIVERIKSIKTNG